MKPADREVPGGGRRDERKTVKNLYSPTEPIKRQTSPLVVSNARKDNGGEEGCVYILPCGNYTTELYDSSAHVNNPFQFLLSFRSFDRDVHSHLLHPGQVLGHRLPTTESGTKRETKFLPPLWQKSNLNRGRKRLQQ